MKLYSGPLSLFTAKVRIALDEKGLEYENKHFNLRASEHKTPEYLKLNPNGYVPTLVHDGFVVCESVVINEYIDDAFPTPPFKPADAKGRARMRGMTKFIDAAIFPSTGIVSLSIAFHYQYSPEAQEKRAKLQPAWYEQFLQVQKGTENPAFPAAIKRLDKMLADMEKALTDSGGPWLLGKDISLADIGYAPYVTRLDHLKFLSHMIAKRPKTAAWYEAMKARKPYEDALAKWFNPKYLPLMHEKGTEAWPKVRALLAA